MRKLLRSRREYNNECKSRLLTFFFGGRGTSRASRVCPLCGCAIKLCKVILYIRAKRLLSLAQQQQDPSIHLHMPKPHSHVPNKVPMQLKPETLGAGGELFGATAEEAETSFGSKEGGTKLNHINLIRLTQIRITYHFNSNEDPSTEREDTIIASAAM